MIKVQRLLTSDLIEEAGVLLYKNYIEQGAWNFTSDNPSRLHVETKNGKKLLIDRFTDHAIWFGAFDGKKLVGCIRLFGIDKNNKFEIEAYPNSRVIHQYLPREDCLEMTRAVVDSNYRGQKILNQLYLISLKYCQQHKSSVFGTANNSFVKSLLKRIEFPLKLEQAFKYESHDAMPVNFYFASYEKGEIENIINRLKELRSEKIPYDVYEILKAAAPLLPVPVYWHDINGAVIGLNEHCLMGMGATADIIGKTPYDFYPQETAEHILKHNDRVMSTGEILSQEEPIQDITTGKKKYYKAIKAPLYDYDGKVIGIVGTSVDISAEKEAEYLRLVNEAQKANLEAQEKFTEIAAQVVHDIKSPTASLQMLIKSCASLPERERIAFREATARIQDIANNLLTHYAAQESAQTDQPQKKDEILEPVLVSALLTILVSEKKFQYQDLPVKFEDQLNDSSNFAFINVQSSAFKRMLSNLINNAVEAVDSQANGKVAIKLDADAEQVQIVISDNGKGMRPELVQKIKNNIAVTEGKKQGHGLGLTQVRETLQRNQGQFTIESKIDAGTTITLKFARVPAPNWIADELRLNKDDIVIILDDDNSIHGAWDVRFESILKVYPALKLIHFKDGQEALAYIDALSENKKEKVFLFNDYELLKQELNGLDIIERSGIKRSILVTSHYARPSVRERAMSMNTKILPKLLASEIPIILIETTETKTTGNPPKTIIPSGQTEIKPNITKLKPIIPPDTVVTKTKATSTQQVVVLDDDPLFLKLLAYQFMVKDCAVESFANPYPFLERLAEFPKNTIICFDYDFKLEEINGLGLAQKLHVAGFTQLYMLTGMSFLADVPAYLTLIPKEQAADITDLIKI